MTIVLAELQGDPVVAHSTGDAWQIRCGITFSGAYALGGDATIGEAIKKLLESQGVGQILWLDVQGDTKGFVFAYNYETNKLQVYQTGGALKGKLEELPAGAYPAEITAAKVRVLAIGK